MQCNKNVGAIFNFADLKNLSSLCNSCLPLAALHPLSRGVRSQGILCHTACPAHLHPVPCNFSPPRRLCNPAGRRAPWVTRRLPRSQGSGLHVNWCHSACPASLHPPTWTRQPPCHLAPWACTLGRQAGRPPSQVARRQAARRFVPYDVPCQLTIAQGPPLPSTCAWRLKVDFGGGRRGDGAR